MKGQIWSADFVASAVIFFTVLFLVIFVWNYSNVQSAESLELKQIQTTAIETSDSMIRTGGLPDNWDSSNVRVIGLADDENILNKAKVISFINVPYSQARALLTGKYNFYFELTYVNGTIIKDSGNNLTAGLQPLNERFVVPIDRYVVYEDKPARMRLIVWS